MRSLVLGVCLLDVLCTDLAINQLTQRGQTASGGHLICQPSPSPSPSPKQPNLTSLITPIGKRTINSLNLPKGGRLPPVAILDVSL